MKKVIIALGLCLAGSAFATEFSAKIIDIDCHISGNKVTRTQSFGKKSELKYTETKNIVMSIDENILNKAMETSSQTPAGPKDEFAYSMVHEGRHYTLNIKDSTESIQLIRMITQICR